MKYPVFALLALCLFSLASCQNNPSGSGSASSLEVSPTNISTVAPAADPKTLSEQMMTDFLEAKKESRKFAPANADNFQMIKNMKMSWSSQGDAEKAHIEKLVREAMMFFEVYQKHEQCIENLDSLSAQVMRGTVKLEDAQKQYVDLREQLKEAGGRLQAGEEKMKAVKNEWERDFPELSKLKRE